MFLHLLLFEATKVSIERKDTLVSSEIDRLKRLYTQMLGPAMNIYRQDKHERRALTLSPFVLHEEKRTTTTTRRTFSFKIFRWICFVKVNKFSWISTIIHVEY
jgi:hypothetical protein